VVLAPLASYLAGFSFGWFPFRPEVYALVAFTSGGVGFLVAGIHAILTKEISLRGGGTMTGQSAVDSGRVCAVIGGCLVAVGGIAQIYLILRQ
jgi:hypothetical protein